MGVKTCNRPGCGAILCDKYSPVWGYICPTCFEELVSSGVETDLNKFMASAPQPVDTEISRLRFEKEFPVT